MRFVSRCLIQSIRRLVPPTQIGFAFSQSQLIQRFVCLLHLVIGDLDHAEGGGAAPYIIVRKTDARICGLDVERKTPFFLFNSSIELFIQTFVILDKYLGRGEHLPPDFDVQVQAIDPSAYALSDWRSLVEYVGGD